MASRVISIDLVGNNASAKKAIAEVGTASEKAARTSAVAFDASTTKIGRSLKGIGSTASQMGVPFASSLNLIGTHFDKAGKSSKGFGSSLSRLGAVEAVAAGAGIAVLASQVGSFITEGREALKIGRQTEAVIKSTGGAANVTASEVSSLAESLSKKAGVDDELIQSGENVLLTFTNIRNEAGKGNDIFNQGTEAALDMSAALGTDLQGSIIQVGKALNDPIRGITALRRVGVSFTESQQDQIKALVDSGQAMEAQKIILGELKTEFGGSAAAMADPFDKLKVSVDNAKEAIGLRLIPILTGAGDAGAALGRGFQSANDATDGLLGKTVAFGAAVPVAVFAVEKLVQGGKAVVAQYGKVGSVLRGAGGLSTLGPVAIGAAAGIGLLTYGLQANAESQRRNKQAAKEFADALFEGGEKAEKAADELNKLSPAASRIAREFTNVALAGGDVGDSAEDIARRMIEAADATGFEAVKLGQLAQGLHDTASAMSASEKQTAQLASAQKDYADLLASGTASESQLARARREVISASRENATTQEQVNRATDAGTSAANRNADATRSQTTANDDLADSLKSLNEDLLAAENSELALERASNDVGVSLLEAARATRDHGAASQQAITAQFALRGSILDVVGAAQRDAQASDDARRARGENISAIDTENNKHNAAIFILASLKKQYPELTGLIDSYRNSLNLIPETIHTNVAISIPGGGVRITGTGIIRRASGGPVPGNDTSGIPILAHPGEYVVSAKGVKGVGMPYLEAINKGAMPQFASGGIVGSAVTHRVAPAQPIYVQVIVEDGEVKTVQRLQSWSRKNGPLPIKIAG